MLEHLLVDSDILIDVSRKQDVAITRLQAESKKRSLAISTVTQMELLVGCRNTAERSAVQMLLADIEVVRLSESISDTAVELLQTYNLSHGLLIPDALIAATAIVYEMPLLSKNQRDFRFITELNLLPYP